MSTGSDTHCLLGVVWGEQNLPVPKEPVVFSKFASSIADPGADIIKAPVVEVRVKE